MYRQLLWPWKFRTNIDMSSSFPLRILTSLFSFHFYLLSINIQIKHASNEHWIGRRRKAPFFRCRQLDAAATAALTFAQEPFVCFWHFGTPSMERQKQNRELVQREGGGWSSGYLSTFSSLFLNGSDQINCCKCPFFFNFFTKILLTFFEFFLPVVSAT